MSRTEKNYRMTRGIINNKIGMAALLSLLLIISGFSWSCDGEQSKTEVLHPEQKPTSVRAVGILDSIPKDWSTLTEDQWKDLLTPDEYNVLRRKGTERAFTGDLLDNKEEGIYTCAGCGLPLFPSNTKFKSGTGWPSYYAPISMKNVRLEKDESFGMIRTEALCNRCGGHLGHVFKDGPEPTGLRYCINSVSLDFVGSDTSKLEN